MADVPAALEVELIYAQPDRYWSERLRLTAPATVADALAACTLPRTVPGLEVHEEHLAVHGRAARPDTPLHDGDRIEILRPLQCDPKEVRRRRAGQRRAASKRR